MLPHFELAGLQLQSYGLLLVTGINTALLLLLLGLRRRGLPQAQALPATVLALGFGLLGARIAANLELGRPAFEALLDPTGGLSFLGGLLLGGAAVLTLVRAAGLPLLVFCDANAPGLAAAYGFARIGCQLAGDGDYGVPSDLPWAMAYPHGLVPTLERVHPTPIYEAVTSFGLAAALLLADRTRRPDGALFGAWLVASSLLRIAVEVVRRNPRGLLGLTQAQGLSLALLAVGVVLLWRARRP